jgi:hypothetical protein
MRYLITKLVTGFILVFITTLTVLYSEGWRLNYNNPFANNEPTDENDNETISKTGMIAVRSIPDGAKVFLTDKLITATDDTITTLIPGKYILTVSKEGYETWQKEVTVYSDLVTDITAVLVLQSPKLEPLTSLDVKTFALSNNQNNIIFTSQNTTQPGLWMLPLNRTGLNLFRNESLILYQDTNLYKPSLAADLIWSIDDESIIVTNTDSTYTDYQISNDRITTANPIKSLDEFNATKLEEWTDNFLITKEATLIEQKAPESILEALKTSMNEWAPDNEKFFIIKDNSLTVYNSEEPLPVGEKRVYTTVENFDPETTKAYWYSDSYHFILVEKNETIPNYYTISLIRIDGTNKTSVYSGILASDKAYPSPAGDKIIVLTSLKENTPTNIYSIGLR